MELTLETIKQLMQYMSEHRIVSLKLGELQLTKTPNDFKPQSSAMDHLELQAQESTVFERAKKDLELDAEIWSMTGNLPTRQPNLKR